MMPPTRIEQLNNFQDAVQSPDGLDRLRALQVIEQALPSSQGLMGLPQVQAPMPVINRFFGGGFADVIRQVKDDGIFQSEGSTEDNDGGNVVAMKVPFMGGSGIATPDPNVSQEQALENLENLKGPFGLDMGSGIAEAFREKLLVPEEQKETGKFFDSAYMVRPTRSNDLKIFARDEEGILNRALQGGVLEGQRYTTPEGKQKTAVIPEGLTIIRDSDEPFIGQFTSEGNQPQVVQQLGRPNIQGFKSKESAMAHARENQGGGMVNVYQLSDGSWDYQRTGRPTNTFMGGGMMAMAGGGQIDPSQAAQGLASFGRYGDNILVHMNPEELSGLASLGKITYNPVTGLPEAWGLKSIFRAVRKLAPVALAIAAPYALGAALGTGVGGLSALQFGLASGVGSFAGNKIAGAKTSDALKAGLFSGAIGGISQGLSTGNWMESAGAKGVIPPGAPIPTEGQNLVSKGVSDVSQGIQPVSQFGTPIPSNIASGSARIGLGGTAGRAPMQLTNLASPGSPLGYTGQLQSNVAADIPSNLGSQIQFEGGGSAFVNPSSTGQTLKDIGSQIYEDYSTKGGVAKLVGMDLMTPDWEAQYAAEAAAKEQQLQDAGYTVDTGFGGQTVIRDSSGVQMPRTLTVQQILDRALGKTPRTKLVADYRYGPSGAKEGGLVSLKHGGEFSGMVPGEGHGMEDNVYMPIVEKGHGSQVGTLAVSPSEYVVDSYTMAALGNGNADAGAKVMDRVVKHVRKKAYGDTEQPNEISGLEALKPMMERV